MLRFLQRGGGQGSAGGTGEERPLKRSKTVEDGPATVDSKQEPASFLTWNCNSLPTRCKDADSIKGLCSLVARLDPDLIALQEVRLTAHAPGKAKRGDGQARDRGKPRDNDKASKEEWLAVKSLMEQEPFKRYQVFWSLADWRYAGTATLVKKTLCQPVKVDFNLESQTDKAGRSCHDDNGRICLLHFPSGLMVLNTYCCNNGWKEESFQRRREWDALLEGFAIKAHASGHQLVWLGDINVAHQDIDVSHPEFFRVQADKTAPKPGPQDAGQPGFTPNEQLRFGKILERGGLVDAFRLLHPTPQQHPPADQPAWTWRGSHHPTDKYHARAMRIDYVLVSQQLQDRVSEAVIIGHGFDRKDFYGSDHCPMFVRLQQQQGATQQAAASSLEPRGSEDTGTVQGTATQPETSREGAGNEPAKPRDEELLIDHDASACQFTASYAGPSCSAPAADEGGDGRPHLSYVMCSQGGHEVMDIRHTYTPEHLRGRGVAEKLCVAAFEFCKSRGIRVLPSCTYVRDRFVANHPDLALLVVHS